MSTGDNARVKKTYPIRGILWGLMLGLGLAIVLIVTTVINLELSQIIIVVLVGTVVGFLWSMFGPARQPKGGARPAPPPLRRQTPEPTAEDEGPATDGSDPEDGNGQDGSGEELGRA